MSDKSMIITPDSITDSLGEVSCAIGAFDGVHKGHRYLITKMVEDARTRGVRSVIITFDRDPDELFCQRDSIRKLLSNDDRIELLSQLGADYLYVLPFTHEFAAHDMLAFLETYLTAYMQPRCIHVGNDFRLGSKASGNVESLTRWGDGNGCRCVGYDLYVEDGSVVTATRIRNLIEQGDVARAADLLGRDHFVRGIVEHGRGEGGARFDIPTANVDTGDVPYVHLKEGVYAGYVTVDGVRYKAAINVGKPPTFSNATSVLEPHILDFDEDIYGREVVVSYHERLRDLIVFKSDEELVETVKANITWVRENL